MWKANTWTVKYDANGGTGAPGQQTKTYGVTLKLSTTKPTRTNYNFLGWGTSPDSTTVAYQAGADYTNNAAITLYAIWELAYIAPIISNLTADRCNSSGTLEDDGTYAKVSFNWEIDAVNSGGLTSIVIQWKQSSALTWNSTTALSGGTSTSGTVNKVIGENALDTEFDYDVQITITDKKGNAVFSVVVPAMWYIMDFLKGGGGIRIGGPANRIGFRDQFNTVFSNGCANLNFTAEDILDPDTTHESLITTNINTPNGGYMYIHTTFYEEKSASANRSQIAVPYNSAGSTYHRYYYNGSWSAWEKHVTESQLNSKLEDTGWIPMESTVSFSQKPMFRKIGKTVYVMGQIGYSDNGIFRNDVPIGHVPAGLEPSSEYGTYECIIPFAYINGSGSKERIYIKQRTVYFAGTSGATSGLLSLSSYLTD